MSSLYRNETTRELGLFLNPPGAGYTKIDDMPAGPRSAIIDWWRALDLDSEISAWHPSIQTGTIETPAPPGVGGRGVNILPRQYSSFTERPTVFKSASLAYDIAEGGYVSSRSLKISTSGINQWIAFAQGDWSWPIKLTPNSRWMLSLHTRVAVSSLPFKITFSATEAGSSSEFEEYPVVSSETANTWTRQVVGIDLTDYAGTQGRFGLAFTSPLPAALYIDAVMLEEWVGDVLAPSAFVDGVG